jgi:FtsH-binding integral membrane protein
MITCCVLVFVLEIAIFCYKGVGTIVPYNYIALGLFTFCMSYMVSFICAIYRYNYDNGVFLVFTATTMTVAITLALTIYACTTKTDITMMGGALFILGMALLLFGIFALIAKSNIMYIVYCCLCVILYGFYLVFDTQLIMGGRYAELSIDNYIVGSMLLYIDVIVLFLKLLQILALIMGKK